MTSATAGLARSSASWTESSAALATPENARRAASAVCLHTIRILNLRRPQNEGSREEAPGALLVFVETGSYFRIDIASMAFALAAPMFPALQAASASRTSFAASPLEALAPATARGACLSLPRGPCGSWLLDGA